MTDLRQSFDAIVAGASAGGVEALLHLLSPLPADFPLPILIVQHLPRNRPSALAQLLGAQCALPVHEAEDKMPVQPGHVYLAPPDYHLLVEDPTTLSLSVDAPVVFSRPAIDVLFESAADVFGPRVLAILLTGASSDGTEGVAAVRRRGGQAWVQAPAEAVVATMPESAITHAGADAVLTLEEMTGRLQCRLN